MKYLLIFAALCNIVGFGYYGYTQYNTPKALCVDKDILVSTIVYKDRVVCIYAKEIPRTKKYSEEMWK